MRKGTLDEINSHDGNFTVDELIEFLPQFYSEVFQCVSKSSLENVVALYETAFSYTGTWPAENHRTLDDLKIMIGSRVRRECNSLESMLYLKENCRTLYVGLLARTDLREIIEEEISGADALYLTHNKSLNIEDYIKLTFNPVGFIPTNVLRKILDVRMNASIIVEFDLDSGLLIQMGLADLRHLEAYKTLSQEWDGSFSDLISAVKEFSS